MSYEHETERLSIYFLNGGKKEFAIVKDSFLLVDDTIIFVDVVNAYTNIQMVTQFDRDKIAGYARPVNDKEEDPKDEPKIGDRTFFDPLTQKFTT